MGSLTNLDEFHTAERSREMLLLGPGTVHENFLPSFEKPPLQYWLSAITLAHWPERDLALRCWPLCYGVGTVIALMLLAKTVEPNRAWVAAGSAALLLTCALFLTEMGRALLDTGLTFFATLALLFAQWARRRPVWWLAVALVCSLGALQKGPLVLGLWLLVLIHRFVRSDERRRLDWKWIGLSLALALAGVMAWPIWQMAHHAMPALRIFGLGEAVDLTGPARLGARPYLEILFRLTTAWPCGLFALIAAVYWARRHDQPMLSEIAVVSLTIIGLSVLLNFRSVRYVVPILPLLCLLLAAGIAELRERKVFIVATSTTIVLALAGWLITQQAFDRRRKDHSVELRVAEELGQLAAGPGRLLLIEPDKHILPEQFYLFYGDLRRSVEPITLGQLATTEGGAPTGGVCARGDLAAVRARFPNALIRGGSGPVVCWQAE